MVGQPQSTNAIVGLILGIVGIIASFFYGIGCLCGIIGLFISYGAKKITDANPLHPDKGTVKAALITNWIAIGIGIMMLVVAVFAGVLYVWANNLTAEETSTSSSLNYYTAEDHSDGASTGTSDILIRLQMTGADTLSWTFTQIKLTVGDNVYDCTMDGGEACTISQPGGDNDNTWEPGEFVFLSESGTDICSTEGCNVGISVMYQGNTVAGDESVIVN
jgi:hypothetical protein